MLTQKVDGMHEQEQQHKQYPIRLSAQQNTSLNLVYSTARIF